MNLAETNCALFHKVPQVLQLPKSVVLFGLFKSKFDFPLVYIATISHQILDSLYISRFIQSTANERLIQNIISFDNGNAFLVSPKCSISYCFILYPISALARPLSFSADISHWCGASLTLDPSMTATNCNIKLTSILFQLLSNILVYSNFRSTKKDKFK